MLIWYTCNNLLTSFLFWCLTTLNLDNQTDTVILWLWYCDTVTVILWYCDTVILWYCDTVILWYCDTVILWLWYCDTVTLWYSDNMTLWYCDTVILWYSCSYLDVLQSTIKWMDFPCSSYLTRICTLIISCLTHSYGTEWVNTKVSRKKWIEQEDFFGRKST